jgi:hypothetical protein
MFSSGNEALVRRRMQWDSFHRWQDSQTDTSQSIEDRITWYAAAFKFARTYSRKTDAADRMTRIEDIRRTRERLAGLKPVSDNV